MTSGFETDGCANSQEAFASTPLATPPLGDRVNLFSAALYKATGRWRLRLIGYGQPLGDCRGQSAFAVLKVDRDKLRRPYRRALERCDPGSTRAPQLTREGQYRERRKSSITAHST
ncbi:hypothetical protein MRX96_019192 [Rhipicephalus microplus]